MKHSLKLGKFFRHDPALDHFDSRGALASSITVRRVMPSRKQSAIGVCSAPSSSEEHIGARAFGDAALPVEHQRVGIARRSARCLEIVQIM